MYKDNVSSQPVQFVLHSFGVPVQVSFPSRVWASRAGIIPFARAHSGSMDSVEDAVSFANAQETLLARLRIQAEVKFEVLVAEFQSLESVLIDLASGLCGL